MFGAANQPNQWANGYLSFGNNGFELARFCRSHQL